MHDLDLREDPEFELDVPDDGEAELADPERRQLAQAVLDAVVRGTTIRDANRLTNLVFHIHHPDRDLTARLDPKREAVLAQQWRELQAQLVRPALDGGTTSSSTATATATTGARWPWGRRVLLVGDSHTDGAFGIELTRLITAAGGTVQREAKVGSAVNHWLPLLPGLLRSHSPDVVIIALGANMRGYPSASGTSRWIRRAVEAVARERPSARRIWIGPPRERKDSDATLAAFDRIIRNGLDADTRFVASDRHTPRYVGRDGVHYDAGPARAWAQGVFAELLR